MKRWWIVGMLSCLLAWPAGATTALYAQGLPVQVGLVGRDYSPEFEGAVEVSYRGYPGPRTLPSSTYRIEDYRYDHGFRLVYQQPDGKTDLPPSFTLEVCGNRAVMTFRRHRHVGCFAWDDDGGGCYGSPPSRPVDTTGCPTR